MSVSASLGQVLTIRFNDVLVPVEALLLGALEGAVAGIVSGGLFVIIWDYLPILGGQTPYAVTGIYSLLLGFFVSLLCIVIVSLLTKAPSKEIVEEFESVKTYQE